MDDDLLLAIRLQEQYNQEAEGQTWRSPQEVVEVGAVNRPKDLSIVDPSWELLDPSPDVHALFLQFNQMFFWGKLVGVEVKWSPKMTLCAGVCSYEGRGGLCSIRLSKPLLTLRPRKDLIQTLLHEMIHALLFVTHNNKDRDSHGPEFLKHMNRINGLTGANISVYHSFHDEVEEYRKHWWRCNGPCQSRKPYFGYVKRAMNRAPSAHDPWWADHQRTCGGTFTKVKEPESSSHKDKKKEKVSESQAKTVTKVKSEAVDIRTFLPFSGTGHKLGESSQSIQRQKVQNVVPSSLELPKPVPKNPVYGILNFTTSSSNGTENKASSSKVPKISVANTKMFINVGGSPVKLFNSRNVASSMTKSGNSNNMVQKKISSEMLTSTNVVQKRTSSEMLTSNVVQKRISSEMAISSQSTPSTSQETNSEGNYGRAPKRPRMDGSQGIKHFFHNVPGVSTTGNKPAITIPRDQQRPTNATISSSQNKKVNCPVCKAEVPEAKINDHLDTCLS
ncbi:PREDICTED: sprT-like domain-containing protein Spartan [Nanorana parkeri]|uniref:sprT-like domain-containing protein Spartan n=1 Tax=Nanorana parkeri TaxID=125878 RepID=UPI000853F35D|nr:PREDICTED: sprT-like domain-containing protein Spartan [Nanorana parkeri]